MEGQCIKALGIIIPGVSLVEEKGNREAKENRCPLL